MPSRSQPSRSLRTNPALRLTVLGACVLLALTSCRIPARSGGGSSKAGGTKVTRHRSASHNYGTGSISSGAMLERAAQRNSYSRGRAQAFLDAGRAYLRERRFGDALRCGHEARRAYAGSSLIGRAYRFIGESHLAAGQFDLAERYLRRGLAGANGTELELTRARLVVALRAVGNTADARLFLSLLGRSPSRGALAILAMKTPKRSTKPRLATGTPQQPAPPVPAAASNFGQLPRLTVRPRAEWGARSPRKGRTTPMGKIWRLTIHHSAGPKDFVATSKSASADAIQRIQRYHQKTKGWADIGYHYVIDRRGEVWQGRSLRYQGAHARGKSGGSKNGNRGNIGIVVLGNYSHNRQHLTAAQRRSLTILAAKLSDHYGISATNIYTHQEISPGGTACPGPEISRYVARVRRSLREWQVAKARSLAGTQPVSYQRLGK